MPMRAATQSQWNDHPPSYWLQGKGGKVEPRWQLLNFPHWWSGPQLIDWTGATGSNSVISPRSGSVVPLLISSFGLFFIIYGLLFFRNKTHRAGYIIQQMQVSCVSDEFVPIQLLPPLSLPCRITGSSGAWEPRECIPSLRSEDLGAPAVQWVMPARVLRTMLEPMQLCSDEPQEKDRSFPLRIQICKRTGQELGLGRPEAKIQVKKRKKNI